MRLITNESSEHTGKKNYMDICSFIHSFIRLIHVFHIYIHIADTFGFRSLMPDKIQRYSLHFRHWGNEKKLRMSERDCESKWKGLLVWILDTSLTPDASLVFRYRNNKLRLLRDKMLNVVSTVPTESTACCMILFPIFLSRSISFSMLYSLCVVRLSFYGGAFHCKLVFVKLNSLKSLLVCLYVFVFHLALLFTFEIGDYLIVVFFLLLFSRPNCIKFPTTCSHTNTQASCNPPITMWEFSLCAGFLFPHSLSVCKNFLLFSFSSIAILIKSPFFRSVIRLSRTISFSKIANGSGANEFFLD